MLDAEAPVVPALQSRGISVNHDAIGPVANRVRVDLKSVRDGVASYPLDIGLRQDQEPAVAGVVGVGGEQGRAAGAECAIGHQLDAADGEPLAYLRTALQILTPQRAF